MPLRVAEKEGYIYGVSKCYDCPFAENLKSDDRAIRIGPFWECGNADADANAGMEVIGVGIPVWCPLPSPLDIWLYGSSKTATEASILERNKMRGLHPENIVWDREPSCPHALDGEVHYLVEWAIAPESQIYNKCVCGVEYHTDILKKKEPDDA